MTRLLTGAARLLATNLIPRPCARGEILSRGIQEIAGQDVGR
ncbi:hypothetical protein [Rhodopila sp.]